MASIQCENKLFVTRLTSEKNVVSTVILIMRIYPINSGFQGYD